MTLWTRWAQWLHQRREQAAIARRPIPDALWRRTLKRFAFLPQHPSPDEQALRRLTSLFLDRKEFTGAHGLTITDDMAVAIAAQACVPVLKLGLSAYNGFVGIVVHPGLARVRREVADEDGVVHEFEETLSGEAVQGGPIMLSWRDVRSAGAKAAQAYNVVIHEFAHVLDMAHGRGADGTPALPQGISTNEWRQTFQAAFQAFCQRVEAGEATAVDPYGASSQDEFFAVSSEAFFVAPKALQAEHPEVYSLLQRYYLQDPAARQRPM